MGQVHTKYHRTNKDRSCEERTTILSDCWTSPDLAQSLQYENIFFKDDYRENIKRNKEVRRQCRNFNELVIGSILWAHGVMHGVMGTWGRTKQEGCQLRI